MKKCPLVMLAVMLLACGANCETPLTDKRYSFSATIPDGFVDFPAGKSSPSIIHSFIRPALAERHNITIVMERMYCIIPRRPLPPENVRALRQQLPPGSEVSVYQTRWQGYEVQGMDVIISSGGETFVNRGVRVPLEDEAVQIVVSGTRRVDAEITLVLEQLLATLEARSSWDPTGAWLRPKQVQRTLTGIKAVTHLAVATTIVALIALATTRAVREEKANADTPTSA